MNRKSLKLLCTVLSLLMIVSMLPFAASAASLAGTGTEADPFVIADENDMKLFSSLVNAGDSFRNKYIVLKSDISFAADEYIPAGTETAPFSGIFDGSGKTVRAAGVNGNYAGVFGYAKSAVIKNLNASGTFAAKESYAGSVAAYAADTVIDSCTADSIVTADRYSGGIAGAAESGTIKNCSSSASSLVSANIEFCGGIAGFSGALIENCRNSANIMTAGFSGGIAGRSENKIVNSVNSGAVSVSSGENVGGIAGFTSSYVTGCINKASVQGQARTGGIAGTSFGGVITDCINTGSTEAAGGYAAGIAAYCKAGEIARCTSTGSVKASSIAGGIFGFSSDTAVKECFTASSVDCYDKAGSAGALNGGSISSVYYVEAGAPAFGAGSGTGASALTDAQAKSADSYTLWSFAENWVFNNVHSEGTGYPLPAKAYMHSFLYRDTFPSTCKEQGYELYLCEDCGQEFRISLPLAEHQFVLATENKKPTCTEKGLETYICSYCGLEKTEETEALGHKDEDKDNKCDICGERMESKPEDTEGDMNIFEKILTFFRKLFDAITEMVRDFHAKLDK